MERVDRVPGRGVCKTDLPEAGTPPVRRQEIKVKRLKLICLSLVRMVKRAGLLPQSFAKALEQRRRQIVLNEREVERLDRIRNPSKYRGK